MMIRAALPALLAASLTSPAALGQTMQTTTETTAAPEAADPAPPAPREAWDTGVTFKLQTGYVYQFNADLDTTGEFAIHRGWAAIRASKPLSRDWTVGFSVIGEAEKWNFTGNNRFGQTNPWSDVWRWGFGARAEWQASDTWQVFFGGGVRLAYEGGADIDDSLTGAGFVGAAYRASKDLTIGGGLGYTSEIEGDGRFFPVIVLNWAITNSITLRSGTFAADRPALELDWRFSRDFSFGVGAGYRRDRFRLSDSSASFNPEGVIEEEAVTAYLRATWTPREKLDVSLWAGMAFRGQLTNRDDSGHEQFEEDYDEPLVMGLSMQYRF